MQPRPETPNPRISKLLIYSGIMLVNKIHYSQKVLFAPELNMQHGELPNPAIIKLMYLTLFDYFEAPRRLPKFEDRKVKRVEQCRIFRISLHGKNIA